MWRQLGFLEGDVANSFEKKGHDNYSLGEATEYLKRFSMWNRAMNATHQGNIYPTALHQPIVQKLVGTQASIRKGGQHL